MNMRDRIAKAWFNSETGEADSLEWLMQSVEVRAEYLKHADAVLAEMMEPTIDMQVAGLEQWLCEAAQEDRSRANWRAMIKAARSQP